MDDGLAILGRLVGDDGARLLPYLQGKAYADGEALTREGEISARLYVIVAGEVEVRLEHAGRTVALGVRGPGAWIGEVGLVDAGPATATVVAKGPVEAFCIDHAALMELTHQQPGVASVLLRHANRQMALRIAESSSGVVEQVGAGRYRVRKPDEVRSWAAQALGWLLGEERR